MIAILISAGCILIGSLAPFSSGRSSTSLDSTSYGAIMNQPTFLTVDGRTDPRVHNYERRLNSRTRRAPYFLY